MASQDPDDPATAEVVRRALTASVSDAMVALYKDVFGRGPTRVRTDFAGPDTIITSLWNTLISAEHGLLEIGLHDRVRETRILVQYSRAAAFREIIESRTRRSVVGFVSGIDVDADVATEVFYLGAPQTRDPAPAAAG